MTEAVIDSLESQLWDRLRRGRVAEAIGFQTRILALSEAFYGTDDFRVSSTMKMLADLYMEFHCFADAGLLYERSLAIEERIKPPDDPRIATSLDDLAQWALAVGRDAQAESLLRRSLTIRRDVHDLEDETVADTLTWLARLYLAPGHPRRAEAMGMLEAALRIATLQRLTDRLWQAQDAMSVAHAASSPEVAVYWGKQAVDTISRRTLNGYPHTVQMQQDDWRRTNHVYTQLAQQLRGLDRAAEAEQVLALMNERDIEDSGLRAGAPEPPPCRP